MKILLVISLIVLACQCVTNVNSDESVDVGAIPRIHPGFEDMHYSVVMMIQMAIFGRCGDKLKAGQLIETNKAYIQFYKCFVDRSNVIAINNNFPSAIGFDKEGFVKSSEYPKYVCEFYTVVHGCISGLLPHLAMCLEKQSNVTIHKMHTAYKHFLEFACDNNAAAFTELWINQNDACLDKPLMRIKSTFNDIIEVDEDQLFSTSTSCRLLSTLNHEFQITTTRVFTPALTCRESLNAIIRNALSRFWNISGCNY